MLSAFLCAGCATIPAGGDPHLLDFLVNGQTTRNKVIEHLGPPARTVESDRMVTYRFAQDKAGYRLAEIRFNNEAWVGREGAQWSLVLVYPGGTDDAQGDLPRPRRARRGIA
jgi:hypothetical protein